MPGRRRISSLKRASIDALCHPGNPHYPIDAREVVRAAAEKGEGTGRMTDQLIAVDGALALKEDARVDYGERNA